MIVILSLTHRTDAYHPFNLPSFKHTSICLNGLMKQQIAFIASSACILSSFTYPSIVSADVSNVAGSLVRTSPASESLTAADLLKSDIDFNVQELKGMSYVLENLNDIIEKREYESIRAVLRQDPLRQLRKTSKALKRFLSSQEIQAKYEESYQSMIDAIDDLDFTANQRFRKEGVPKEGLQDTQLTQQLKTAVIKLNEMIDIVPK